MNKIVPERFYKLGTQPNEMRELFEYGKKRKLEVGDDKVYDYSLGNPSSPAPAALNDSIREVLGKYSSIQLHGYTSSQGDQASRQTIADYLNKTHGFNCSGGDLYLTCGAASALAITLNAISMPGDEAIVFVPYFTEYKVFVEDAGMKLVEVPCRRTDFQIDFDALESAVNEHTKAVIINSPNNPTGAVIPEKDIIKLAKLLDDAQKKYGSAIFLIADEPYRELVYDDDITVPFVPKYYDNSIINYSFSKALSMPGERFGYIMVSPKSPYHDEVYFSVCGAGRSMGYICAPAIFQRAVPMCLGQTADISVYKTNRDILYNALVEYGYEVVHPDGAFYLFIKAMEPDAYAFCEKAKSLDLLIVPSDTFGMGGYVRIAYCVDTDMVRRSLPAFRKLAEMYGK